MEQSRQLPPLGHQQQGQGRQVVLFISFFFLLFFLVREDLLYLCLVRVQEFLFLLLFFLLLSLLLLLLSCHPVSCKLSSGGSGLSQMIICHPSKLCQDPHSISQTSLDKFVHVFNFLASQITNVGKPFLFDQTLLLVVLLQVEYREFRREYTGITTRQKK